MLIGYGDSTYVKVYIFILEKIILIGYAIEKIRDTYLDIHDGT